MSSLDLWEWWLQAVFNVQIISDLSDSTPATELVKVDCTEVEGSENEQEGTEGDGFKGDGLEGGGFEGGGFKGDGFKGDAVASDERTTKLERERLFLCCRANF